MLSKILSKEIREAADDYSMETFIEYLQDLDREGKIEITRDGWDYVIDFAKYLLERMLESVNKGEWFGYEIKALNALEEMNNSEDDIIIIDAYGYPKEIEDNNEILSLFGIENQLREAA